MQIFNAEKVFLYTEQDNAVIGEYNNSRFDFNRNAG